MTCETSAPQNGLSLPVCPLLPPREEPTSGGADMQAARPSPSPSLSRLSPHPLAQPRGDRSSRPLFPAGTLLPDPLTCLFIYNHTSSRRPSGHPCHARPVVTHIPGAELLGGDVCERLQVPGQASLLPRPGPAPRSVIYPADGVEGLQVPGDEVPALTDGGIYEGKRDSTQRAQHR